MTTRFPRARRAVFPATLLAALACGALFLVEESRADLDGQVFSSRADNLRFVVPRGWRATDQPSYPGLLLWMMRSQPQGQILLTGEAFTRDLYCSWPVSCRTTHDAVPVRYACAIRTKLAAQRMKLGPIQQGPRETEAAGLPSVWFEYDDGKHFLRQAVAMSDSRAVSLVLSAASSADRTAHARAFEQALRSMTTLSTNAPGAVPDASGDAIPLVDAGPDVDAAQLVDAGALDAGVTFVSAPAPEIPPIGACPK